MPKGKKTPPEATQAVFNLLPLLDSLYIRAVLIEELGWGAIKPLVCDVESIRRVGGVLNNETLVEVLAAIRRGGGDVSDMLGRAQALAESSEMAVSRVVELMGEIRDSNDLAAAIREQFGLDPEGW